MPSPTPERLTAQLAVALPTQLQSVVLFGSAVTGEFLRGWSNFNLLVVCRSLGISELDALAPPVAAWIRGGNPSPLLFTTDELVASRDAFPIELLDIQQSRRVLWGDDLLANLRIERGQLRVQVERELKGKLLALRGRYLELSGRSAAIDELMLRSLPTFLVLFRAMLRLYDDDVPPTKLLALESLRRHIPFNTAPFERLEAHRRLTPAMRPQHSGVVFADYVAAIESVVRGIDTFSLQPSNERKP